MKSNEIKIRITSLCSHLTFDFEGKSCGVDPLAADQFDMWCGHDTMTAKSADEVMNTPFFDGKCLKEIADEIQNIGI